MTNDIRKAGISKKDEDFFDQFSSDMLDKNNKTIQSLSQVDVDKETSKKLAKAKKMNAKIFKQIHPKEYQQ